MALPCQRSAPDPQVGKSLKTFNSFRVGFLEGIAPRDTALVAHGLPLASAKGGNSVRRLRAQCVFAKRISCRIGGAGARRAEAAVSYRSAPCRSSINTPYLEATTRRFTRPGKQSPGYRISRRRPQLPRPAPPGFRSGGRGVPRRRRSARWRRRPCRLGGRSMPS